MRSRASSGSVDGSLRDAAEGERRTRHASILHGILQAARAYTRAAGGRGVGRTSIDKPTSPSGSEAGTQRPGLNDDLAPAKDNGCQSHGSGRGPRSPVPGAPAQPARKRRERARVRKTPDASAASARRSEGSPRGRPGRVPALTQPKPTGKLGAHAAPAGSSPRAG